jgi:hypothetical protein
MNNNKNQTSFSQILFLLGGILIGMGIFKFFLKGGDSINNTDEIIAAIPEDKRSDPSKYIFGAVKFTARLEKEISEYKKTTSINRVIQDLLANGKNSSVSKQMIANSFVSCPDDTIQGVNFDLIPIITSLLKGQNKTNIADLVTANYGIYVAFARYPDSKPSYIPNDVISDADYNSYFKGRRTAFLNYTFNSGSASAPEYTYLNFNNERLGDDIGMICPHHCPE